jgi:hypothetical protein
VTVHEEGRAPRRFTSTAAASQVRFSTTSADVSIGRSTVTVDDAGDYVIAGVAREEGSGTALTFDLTVRPQEHAYFPPADIGAGTVTSGYVVPALRADAGGSICVGADCTVLDGVQSYHDHNWGVWRGVTWEWGSARAGEYSLLYGGVQLPGNEGSEQPLFVYLVDSLGFRALFRPRTIDYAGDETAGTAHPGLMLPRRASMMDIRGSDTLRIELAIEDIAVTDTRGSRLAGESGSSRGTGRPYFLQMKGVATISGRIGGEVVSGSGAGFFETYR